MRLRWRNGRAVANAQPDSYAYAVTNTYRDPYANANADMGSDDMAGSVAIAGNLCL